VRVVVGEREAGLSPPAPTLAVPAALAYNSARMTPAEFKTKWAKVTAKETSAYVEHFNDLCRMLRLPTPLEADPTGCEFFCFQKHVLKDAELFSVAGPDAGSVRLLTSAATRDEHRTAIAAAAQELNALRERWLNPPEWTETRTLTFPGSAAGPWARYVDPATVDAKTGVGTVRYPRLEPRDADSAAKLKKRTLTNLYNERPAWLDLAHKKLDAAAAAAYGFPADLSDEQILERLLALNLERAAEEAKAAKVKQPKTSRGKQADELI